MLQETTRAVASVVVVDVAVVVATMHRVMVARQLQRTDQSRIGRVVSIALARRTQQLPRRTTHTHDP